MSWFIRLLALCYIVIGLFGLVATKRFNQVLSNFIKNSRPQTLGLLALIIGVLLLLSATAARESWFIMALGIISCLKGVTVILSSKQKLKAIMDWWFSGPDIVFKGYAAFALILGVVLFYII